LPAKIAQFTQFFGHTVISLSLTENLWGALYSPNMLSYGLYNGLVSSEQGVKVRGRSKELSVGCDVTDRDIEKMKRFRGRYQQMALTGKIQIKKKKYLQVVKL
jgi:hypothetical protein